MHKLCWAFILSTYQSAVVLYILRDVILLGEAGLPENILEGIIFAPLVITVVLILHAILNLMGGMQAFLELFVL